MNNSRWLPIASLIVGVNIVAVFATSFWHLANGGFRSTTSNDAGTTASVSQAAQVNSDFAPPTRPNSDGSAEVEVTPNETKGPESISNNPANIDAGEELANKNTELAELPSVDSAQSAADSTELEAVDPELEYPELGLDEIPSMATDPSNDPIFQEFESLLSGGRDRDLTRHSEQFYVELKKNITAANHLTSAASELARQAVMAERQGNTAKAQRLVQMLTQLREIAAEMLTAEAL